MATTVKFERHLGEQLVFPVTFYDGTGARQSVLGVTDLRMSIFKQDAALTAVVTDDSTHCSIVETGPANAGDVLYSAPPGTVPEVGRYLMRFLATLNGVPIAFPEKGYMQLVIT